MLTVKGTGFTSAATVTVGGVDCPVEDDSRTSSTLVCRAAAASAGAVDVIVDVEGTTATSGTQFTYGTGSDPTITAVTISDSGATVTSATPMGM